MTSARRVPLSRARILHAALRIVDREGTDKLTMRRLGQELGVDPMAVYRHVPGKSALFDGIMETIWASVDVDEATAHDGWERRLAAVMHGLRRTLLRHPRAVSILGTRPVAGAELFALLERVLGVLVDAGLPADADTAEQLNVLVNYTVGHVLAESGEPVGGEADPHSNLTISPQAFPHLAAVFNSGWRYDPDRQFDRGIRAIIDGWRGPTSPPDPAEPETGPTERRLP